MFADLPGNFGIGIHYVVVFINTVLVGLLFVCINQVFAELGERSRERVEFEGLKDIDTAPLRLSFSWFLGVSDDVRNRQLVDKIKYGIVILLLLFAGVNIFLGLLKFSYSSNESEGLLMEIGLLSLMFWIMLIFVFVHVNRKYWAPSIDADKKLREAFGAEYDLELDKQLETKSIKDLVDEKWFIRMYTRQPNANVS